MKNMPLLKEGAELSLEALKVNFRANDFSTAVSGYDCDRASSQDNRFYERLQKHFAKVWNAQMLQLSKKGSLLNYSSNHPVRCLEEAEAKLVAGTVMEILDMVSHQYHQPGHPLLQLLQLQERHQRHLRNPTLYPCRCH